MFIYIETRNKYAYISWGVEELVDAKASESGQNLLIWVINLIFAIVVSKVLKRDKWEIFLINHLVLFFS